MTVRMLTEKMNMLVHLVPHANFALKPVCSSQGFTPLHLACDRGQTTSVRLLLKSGARTDILVSAYLTSVFQKWPKAHSFDQDSDGFSALDLAKVVDNKELIQLLSDAGASRT
jgi:ankyrin repeat protein